jgi:hypothetical protein
MSPTREQDEQVDVMRYKVSTALPKLQDASN